MSWAFISAIKANPKQSYVQLLNSIRDVLETKYTQKPQLSSSHPIGKLLSSVSTAPFSLRLRCRHGRSQGAHETRRHGGLSNT